MGVYSQILLLCLIAVCNIFMESDAVCDTVGLIKCRLPDFSDQETVCADVTAYRKCFTDADCVINAIIEQTIEQNLDALQINCGGCSDEFRVSSGRVYNPYTFWNSQPLTEYCKSQNFKKQVGCLIDADRSPQTAEFQSLLAKGDDYVSAVDTLCSNLRDLDRVCMLTIIQCLNTEAQAKEPTLSDFKAHKEYTCKLFESYGSCIEPKTGTETCSNLNTKEVLKTVHGKLVPPACGASALLVTSILLISSILVSMFL